MTDTATKLHRSKTTGEWVPCRATKRACPREHVILNASGDIERQALLADVLADVKKRNKVKPIEEQIEAIRTFREEIGKQQTPLAEVSGAAYDEYVRLTEKRWSEAEPRDYLSKDDYAGLQQLVEDASWGSAPNDYLNAFVTGLDPHFQGSGTYDSSHMLPSMEVLLKHGEGQEELNKLASTMQGWTQFTLRHREDESNKRYQQEADEFEYDDEDAEATAPASQSFQFFTYDLSQKGIPLVTVYEDGQATALMQVHGSLQTINRSGDPTWSRVNGNDLYEARKPLPELLGELTKVWYYPESSNPNHKREHHSWDDDDDYYSEDD